MPGHRPGHRSHRPRKHCPPVVHEPRAQRVLQARSPRRGSTRHGGRIERHRGRAQRALVQGERSGTQVQRRVGVLDKHAPALLLPEHGQGFGAQRPSAGVRLRDPGMDGGGGRDPHLCPGQGQHGVRSLEQAQGFNLPHASQVQTPPLIPMRLRDRAQPLPDVRLSRPVHGPARATIRHALVHVHAPARSAVIHHGPAQRGLRPAAADSVGHSEVRAGGADLAARGGARGGHRDGWAELGATGSETACVVVACPRGGRRAQGAQQFVVPAALRVGSSDGGTDAQPL
mmetsp:Transcript_25195/g.64470  ORF Transcript_25195/g.64470 Transcript_25195/m.64470 type:complete len:286 (+) Transcript_25195:7036-7893(+)